MSKTIKLTETEFKNFIKESVINVINTINEEEKPAFDRSKGKKSKKEC